MKRLCFSRFWLAEEKEKWGNERTRFGGVPRKTKKELRLSNLYTSVGVESGERERVLKSNDLYLGVF